MNIRIITWATIITLGLLTCVAFLFYFPKNYPEKMLQLEEMAQGMLNEITLPIKTARLMLAEPDANILMPVYGVQTSSVTDTWQAPRDGVRTHDGQDIFSPRGTPIFSGTEGYIRRIRTTEIGGNNVLINGAGGRRYYYAHLDRFAEGLHAGQWVTTDTVIGFVGNTGNAQTTPPHLHFGIYQRREAINPLPLLVDRN